MSKLILMRHGQSEWNKQNLFTGWVDVPLSPLGIEEAFAGGKKIKDIPIDVIITTTLIRAQMTAMLAMSVNMSVHSDGKTPVILHKEDQRLSDWGKIFSEDSKKNTIPVITCWELNERMYGELQGLNKAETIAKFGGPQVKIWRRSFDVAPPGGESLKMTAERSIPYFKNSVLPLLQEGKNVFISAHGNSLRSIVMYLDHLSEEEVLHLEIATGDPLIYDYDNGLFARG